MKKPEPMNLGYESGDEDAADFVDKLGNQSLINFEIVVSRADKLAYDN